MASYEWPIGGSLVAEVAVMADFQDEVTFDIVRAPPQAIEGSYWLYDARIGETWGMPRTYGLTFTTRM